MVTPNPLINEPIISPEAKARANNLSAIAAAQYASARQNLIPFDPQKSLLQNRSAINSASRLRSAQEAIPLAEQADARNQQFNKYLDKISSGEESLRNVQVSTYTYGDGKYLQYDVIGADPKSKDVSSGSFYIQGLTPEEINERVIGHVKSEYHVGPDDTLTVNSSRIQDSNLRPEEFDLASRVQNDVNAYSQAVKEYNESRMHDFSRFGGSVDAARAELTSSRASNSLDSLKLSESSFAKSKSELSRAESTTIGNMLTNKNTSMTPESFAKAVALVRATDPSRDLSNIQVLRPTASAEQINLERSIVDRYGVSLNDPMLNLNKLSYKDQKDLLSAGLITGTLPYTNDQSSPISMDSSKGPLPLEGDTDSQNRNLPDRSLSVMPFTEKEYSIPSESINIIQRSGTYATMGAILSSNSLLGESISLGARGVHSLIGGSDPTRREAFSSFAVGVADRLETKPSYVGLAIESPISSGLLYGAGFGLANLAGRGLISGTAKLTGSELGASLVPYVKPTLNMAGLGYVSYGFSQAPTVEAGIGQIGVLASMSPGFGKGSSLVDRPIKSTLRNPRYTSKPDVTTSLKDTYLTKPLSPEEIHGGLYFAGHDVQVSKSSINVRARDAIPNYMGRTARQISESKGEPFTRGDTNVNNLQNTRSFSDPIIPKGAKLQFTKEGLISILETPVLTKNYQVHKGNTGRAKAYYKSKISTKSISARSYSRMENKPVIIQDPILTPSTKTKAVQDPTLIQNSRQLTGTLKAGQKKISDHVSSLYGRVIPAVGAQFPGSAATGQQNAMNSVHAQSQVQPLSYDLQQSQKKNQVQIQPPSYIQQQSQESQTQTLNPVQMVPVSVPVIAVPTRGRYIQQSRQTIEGLPQEPYSEITRTKMPKPPVTPLKPVIPHKPHRKNKRATEPDKEPGGRTYTHSPKLWYPAAYENVTYEEFNNRGTRATHISDQLTSERMFRRQIQGSGNIPTAKQYKKIKLK